MENFFYKVNDKDYEVVVVIKRIKNIHYHFRDGKFLVSCNRYVTKRQIIVGLDRFAKKLVERGEKKSGQGDNFIYLFGEKMDLPFPGSIRISGYPPIKYKDMDDLNRKLKPIFLDIVTERVKYYEKLMKVPSYRVTVRNMKTRLGSNSKSQKHITIAYSLIHYSTPILDSVIVHELAHIKEYNHSKKFYDVVYKYCHDYPELRRKLVKGEFK